MPITVSYDLTGAHPNERNYLRSMLERFHWKRLGGSVLRYDGIEQPNGSKHEDWLNHVAPALMFFRSYVRAKDLQLKFFTIDASSISFLDHSDPQALLGSAPESGQAMVLAEPTNQQSAIGTIRQFIDTAENASGAPAP